jgi:hypothetical protein
MPTTGVDPLGLYCPVPVGLPGGDGLGCSYNTIGPCFMCGGAGGGGEGFGGRPGPGTPGGGPSATFGAPVSGGGGGFGGAGCGSDFLPCGPPPASAGPPCDFGACNPIGNGFLGAGISSAASFDPGLLQILAGIPFFLFGGGSQANLIEGSTFRRTNSATGQTELGATWGKFGGCNLTGQLPVAGGACVTITPMAPGPGTNCYAIPAGNGCTQTICPGSYRGINGSCTGFTGPFPTSTNQVCVKITP